ncbi:response regulator transcription factor [Paraburkholderia sp. MMS20-SJTN17]|uniref:Response regulator transcription factor n=1 Tax=Paraburkholderia translucens TaxID=2886945 RepID=A0ABS8KKI7_9BURK|nr:response regulator transcription factor [Paraburkholderia sp. MMS20-SJTN17]MCC8405283.1 response regulator transcription factor [Paraburkholderia sp. MMS20-SJTN17]
MVRLFIAESQSMAREALRIVLETAGHEVAGEAGDGLRTVREVLRLKPDVLIVDVRLARLNGIEVIQRLRRRRQNVCTLVLSEQDGPHIVAMCMKAGASGFISKTASLDELFRALDSLAHNRMHFPVQASTDSVRGSTGPGETDPLRDLSPRELAVLQHLASGQRVSEIAKAMALSDRTISTYKQRLLRKLNAASVVDLLEIARLKGITRGEPEPESEREAGLAPDATGAVEKVARALLDAFPGPATMRDLDGRVIYLNNYLRLRHGTAGDALIGTDPDAPGAWFLRRGKDGREMRTLFFDAVARGIAYTKEVVTEIDGGETRGIEWGAPIRDMHGNVVMMLCGLYDLSGHERSFAQLRDAHARAIAASRAKSRLLRELVDVMGAVLEGLDSSPDNAIEGNRPRTLVLDAPVSLEMQRRGLCDQLGDLRRLIEGAAMLDVLPERHDLKALTAATLAPLREEAVRNGRSLTFGTNGRASQAVWIDAARYRRLLACLVACVGAADITFTLRCAAHTGGLFEVVLTIEAPGGGHAGARRPGVDAAIRHAEWQLCRDLAVQMAMLIDVVDDTADFVARFECRLPRAI